MKINKKEVWRTIKYVLFAASAGAIQILTSFLLQLVIFKYVIVIPEDRTIHFIIEHSLSVFLSETIALALSIIWNFTFNRKFTFKAATNVPKSMALAFLFYVPFYPFQVWYMAAVTEALTAPIGADGAYVIAQLTVILINFVLEFTWQRFVVFRKKLDTNDVAQKQAQKQREKDAALEVAASDAPVEPVETPNAEDADVPPDEGAAPEADMPSEPAADASGEEIPAEPAAEKAAEDSVE